MADYFTRPVQSDRMNANFGRCRKLTVEERSDIRTWPWVIAPLVFGVLVGVAVVSGAKGASPTATGLSPTVEPASSLDGFATSIPSALDFDIAFATSPEPELSLEWILLGVDRKGEAFVLDADSDFFKVDLLPEFWACDNGIEYPDGLAAGLYLMAPVFIKPDSEGDHTFKGTIEPLCLGAQAIEARRAETGTGSVHESAVPSGMRPTSPTEELPQ